MNSVEVSKEEDLRVSLSSVSRLRPLRRLSNLDDDHVAGKRRTRRRERNQRTQRNREEGDETRSERNSRNDVTFELVETRVDLSVVELLGSFSDGLEEQRLWIQLRVDSEDIEDDSRSRSIVSTSDDVSVAENEHELPFVVVLESRERVERSSKGFLSLGVAGDLADDELVLELGIPFRGELKSGEDCERRKR